MNYLIWLIISFKLVDIFKLVFHIAESDISKVKFFGLNLSNWQKLHSHRYTIILLYDNNTSTEIFLELVAH